MDIYLRKIIQDYCLKIHLLNITTWDDLGIFSEVEGGYISIKSAIEVTFDGRKYISLRELCRDLNLPYSLVMHKYYRTGSIDGLYFQ